MSFMMVKKTMIKKVMLVFNEIVFFCCSVVFVFDQKVSRKEINELKEYF